MDFKENQFFYFIQLELLSQNLKKIFFGEKQSSRYSGFSHEVTKFQTTKLSIVLMFYFHDVLEQLKTNVHTNFRFKTVPGFVLEYA